MVFRRRGRPAAGSPGEANESNNAVVDLAIPQDLTYCENGDIINNSMSRTPAARKQDMRASIRPVSEALPQLHFL
jgi:hypothetical protein